MGHKHNVASTLTWATLEDQTAYDVNTTMAAYRLSHGDCPTPPMLRGARQIAPQPQLHTDVPITPFH
jgi:hypothetical protein